MKNIYCLSGASYTEDRHSTIYTTETDEGQWLRKRARIRWQVTERRNWIAKINWNNKRTVAELLNQACILRERFYRFLAFPTIHELSFAN